jgi:predicted RNase H-like nuclease (RuvC/YqgF family)
MTPPQQQEETELILAMRNRIEELENKLVESNSRVRELESQLYGGSRNNS